MENAVEKVKRKLWSYGYSAKDVSDVPGLGYDLLVEGKYRVRVSSGKSNIENVVRGVVVAIVDGDEIRYNVCKNGKCWEESSPQSVFQRSKN